MNHNWRRVFSSAVAILGLTMTSAPTSRSAAMPMNRVGREMLCVTEGALQEMADQRLSVNVPKMRAYVSRWTSPAVAAHFTYMGASANEAKLASGQARRQFGFKLRAQDPCNLVYAMWRMEPESKLVVSVKMNPGQHTSAECGNRGYRNIKPLHDLPVPVLRPGDKHSFRAEMDGERLRVLVDDSIVWDGKVGTGAMRFDGPVGIRSDNARLQFELLSGAPLATHPNFAVACKADPESD